MTNPISRRELLLSAAGACALAQEGPIHLGTRQVEITLTPVTRDTVRITVQPIENGNVVPVPVTGALVEKGWAQPVARVRALTPPRTLKSWALTVKLSNNPLTIRVEGSDARLVQQLNLYDST